MDEEGQDPPYGDEGENFQDTENCEKGSGPHGCGVWGQILLKRVIME